MPGPKPSDVQSCGLTSLPSQSSPPPMAPSPQVLQPLVSKLRQLDAQYQRAADEVQQLRAQIAEERLVAHRARDGET